MQRAPRDVELEALREQLCGVLARLDTALAQNAELVQQVAKLNERIAELLPVAKRKARKARPTVPSEAPPPTMSEEQRLAFENRHRPPDRGLHGLATADVTPAAFVTDQR